MADEKRTFPAELPEISSGGVIPTGLPFERGKRPEPAPAPLLKPDISGFDPSKKGFDTSVFLNQNGVKIIAPGSERGRLIVENDESGERKEINVSELLTRRGIDPNEFNFVLNRPETALPTSPLSVFERLLVKGLGNRRGQISWLKKNFEDVAEIPDSRDLVIQKDGVWHRVDGEIFSNPDPWSWSRGIVKEIFSDVADVTPELLTGTAVATTAILSGGTALAAAPAIGAGSEILRTSLGRLANTYEATVDEQILDVVTEAMLVLGGEGAGIALKGIGIAAKPKINQLFKAVAKIKQGSSEATQAMLSQGFGVMNKTGPRASAELFKNPLKLQNTINGFMKQAVKNTKSTRFSQESLDELARLGGKEMESNMAEFSRMSGRTLSKIWTDGTKRILKNVPDDASFNVGQTGVGLLQTLEKMGFGQIKKSSEGALKFKTFTKTEIRKNLEELTGTPASTFTQQQLDAVGPLIRDLEDLTVSSILKGKAGANQLIEDRGSLSKLITNIGDEYPQIKAPLEQIRENLDTQISKGLTFVSVGRTSASQRVIKTDSAIRQFESLRKRWSSVADNLKAVKAIAPGDKEVPTMQALMTDSPVRSRQLRDAIADVIDSMDEAGVPGGQKILDRMMHIEAAVKYADWKPRIDKLQGIGAAAIAFSTPLGGFVGTFVAATSPALGRRLAISMGSVVNLLKTLNPTQVAQVLKNDFAMRNLMQGTVRSAFESVQLEGELQGQLQQLQQLQGAPRAPLQQAQ